MNHNICRFIFIPVCVLAVVSGLVCFRASAQGSSGGPSFEVATVKPSLAFDPRHYGMRLSEGRASYWSMDLASLLAHAYGIQRAQIGDAQFIGAGRYDIEARLPEGADKKDEPKMLQALLRDRFRLALHIEQKEMEGYALVVDKHSPNLKPAVLDSSTHAMGTSSQAGGGAAEESPTPSNVSRDFHADTPKKQSQTVTFDQERGVIHYEVSSVTMGELAKRLVGCLGTGFQKVVDETGLEGTYQLAYDCPLPMRQSSSSAEATDPMPSGLQGSSLVTHALNVLGLKLVRRKMVADLYVIDHVEVPIAN